MARNIKAGPGRPKGDGEKHGLQKYRQLKWSDEESITSFIHSLREDLGTEEFEMLKIYIRTLAEDEELNLTSFEIKRIAVAMLALDRADKWFFKNADEENWQELKIELQNFLRGKEDMVIRTLEKARDNKKKVTKSLFDQLSDEFKDFEINATGEVEGVEYEFSHKKTKTKKPKMITVEVTEEEEDEDGE